MTTRFRFGALSPSVNVRKRLTQLSAQTVLTELRAASNQWRPQRFSNRAEHLSRDWALS
jgi:hypothetical protein